MKPANRISLDAYMARIGPSQKSLFRSDGTPEVKRKKLPLFDKTAEERDWRSMFLWMYAQLETPLTGVYARLHQPARDQMPGRLVVRFALPLELCPTVNMVRQMPPWRYGQVKDQLFSRMWIQMAHQDVRPYEPLPGFPAARCVCFSPRERDPNCGFEKQALDICLPARERRNRKNRNLQHVSGLGLIKDDRGTKLHRSTWWEPAPKGVQGGVLIEIWTGDEQ